MNNKTKSNINIAIFIIIFIISLIWLKNYLVNYEQEKCLSIEFWKNKNNKIHSKLKEMFILIKPILDKCNIIYWAHAGTLLGTVRHKGFIPWDDDIDIVILYEEEKINNLIKELENNNFSVINVPWGIQIRKGEWTFIDIFYYYKENNILVGSSFAQYMWPNEYYYVDEVFDLKYDTFENILLPVPKNSDIFLKRAFGDDYMNNFYINFYHDPFSNIIDFFSINYACNDKYNMNQIKK
jgi:Txe/YoeB family toxin of Txe-Axe toxin-antitoxin module